MKINKFNESIEDELYYEGDIHFHFKIPYNSINNYTSIFSYNAADRLKLIGIIEHYVLHKLELNSSDHLTKIELGKNENIIKDINYKLIDKDGTIIDQNVINDKNNYNL